jgi:hypothetical protein
MKQSQSHRIPRVLSPQQQARLQQQRRRIARELPDLQARDQMRSEARLEPTLSGELRRAVHASRKPLSEIASSAGIPVLALDEFLTGERTLRSDVLDRLASSIGFVLSA